MASLKEKAKDAGSMGISYFKKYVEGRKRQRAEKAELYGRFAKQVRAKSSLARVEMGLPPDLKEQGVPMASAQGLLSGGYKAPISGMEALKTQRRNLKELFEQFPEEGSAQAQRIAELRKQKVVHGSISRRNPELYVKPGAEGAEDTTPSVLKQIARQRKVKGSAYES